MNLRPVLEESFHVHFQTKQYNRLHLLVVVALALTTVIVWPTQGFMSFFRSQTVPSAFQVVAILSLLILTGVAIYAGMDRVAERNIIRYSEWLGSTDIRVSELLAGKLLGAFVHTLFLIAVCLPFLVISAGPAGIPLRALFSTVGVHVLAALFCRIAGMVISIIGEERDVIRIVGSWIFIALLYLATIRFLQPLNPIIAVSRQQSETSPLVASVGSVAFANHPLVPSAVLMLTGILIFTCWYAVAMQRRRVLLRRPMNG